MFMILVAGAKSILTKLFVMKPSNEVVMNIIESWRLALSQNNQPIVNPTKQEIADVKKWNRLMILSRPVQFPVMPGSPERQIEAISESDVPLIPRDIFLFLAMSIQYKNPVWAKTLKANLDDFIDLPR